MLALPLPEAVRPLSDPGATLADVGGKALNLGVMLRAGLPVPGGFVLTTAAYRSFVEANGLEPLIAAAWTQGTGGGPDALELASARIRASFEGGTTPIHLVEAVRAALHATAEGAPVAVRSSATAEDLPDASFAGQQDTFLNQRGPDAVLDAARRCWGSLWTGRAMAYRARQGITPDQVALAVVIQRMAPADVAGVLFTAHPVSGRLDRAVINATWGLGEALVGGRVNPDTLVVDKATGRVLKAERGDKAVMTAETETGTAEVEVEARRRDQLCLSEAQAASLVQLGVRLEALFGGPQDVEWAIVRGEPVLLQSRAVTTPTVPGDDAWPPTERGEPQPFDFWTQQDMGERWPDPVTPLTWSVSEPLNQEVLDGMLNGLKAPYAGRICWSRRVSGHVYMNEGALLYAYTQGMGMPITMMASGITHPAAVPPGSEGWRLGPALRHLPFFWKVATSWEKNVDRFELAFPQIDALVDGFMAEDLASRTDTALLDEAMKLWFGRVMEYVALHTSATSLSMSSYDELEAFVKKQGEPAELAQTLVGGITGVVAAEMVPELAGLARALREAGLADEVLARSPADALALLRGEPRAVAFRSLLETFLKRHGHRCMVEAELRFPRWCEAPEQVIEQVQGTLRFPPRAEGEATRRREEATAALRARLGFFAKMGLDRALSRAHRFTRMRDNGQGYVVKLLMPVRVLLAELGRRLAARGRLRQPDDVFFLVLDELYRVAGRDESLDLQAKADARRLAYDHWFTQAAPDALDANEEPVPPPLPEGADERTLVGVPVSRGVVSGIARVVATPAEASRLQPGEILVTRATDPGWTPVFSVIGGAVLEVGGMLSHGAIVAREYGLPAVVNVSGCTRRIQDGQRITVDGSSGRVTLDG